MSIFNLTPKQELECELSLIECERQFGPNIYEQADPYPFDDLDYGCDGCEFDEFYIHSACINCPSKGEKRKRR
jgi:hypothetical protein